MNTIPLKSLAVLSSILMLLALFAQPASAAPVTTLTVSEPSYGSSPMYVNSLTEFTISVSETADVWYRWGANSYTKYTGPFTAVVLAPSTGGAPPLPMDLEEGPHTLHYNASGESPRSFDIVLDNLYPITEYSFNGPAYMAETPSVKSTTRVVLTATDAGVGVSATLYSINGGSFMTYTAPFSLPGPGQYSVRYHSMDFLGNEEPLRTFSLVVDDSPPVVEILPGEPKLVVSGTTFIGTSTPITLNIIDASGIASASYRIDAGPWTPYTGPFTVPVQAIRTIYARATDNLGHASAEASLMVNVDGTPPSVSVQGTVGNSIHLRAGEALVLQCTDAGVGICTVRYSFDGGVTWTDYTDGILLSESQNVTYYAVDTMGNAASQQTVQVIIIPQEALPWKQYLGYGLIIAGILVGISTFFMGRKSRAGDDDREDMPEEEAHRK